MDKNNKNMRKQYIIPAAFVVMLQHRSQILIVSGDGVTSMEGNAGLNYGAKSSNDTSGQGARIKESVDIWDEEW